MRNVKRIAKCFKNSDDLWIYKDIEKQINCHCRWMGVVHVLIFTKDISPALEKCAVYILVQQCLKDLLTVQRMGEKYKNIGVCIPSISKVFQKHDEKADLLSSQLVGVHILILPNWIVYLDRELHNINTGWRNLRTIHNAGKCNC